LLHPLQKTKLRRFDFPFSLPFSIRDITRTDENSKGSSIKEEEEETKEERGNRVCSHFECTSSSSIIDLLGRYLALVGWDHNLPASLFHFETGGVQTTFLGTFFFPSA